MSSRIVPDNRAGQVGTIEAKQPKMRLSTLSLFFFCILEADCDVRATGPKPEKYQTYTQEDVDFTC